MVILIVALVVVGPKRLPEVGKTIGKSLREFRKATDEVKQSFDFNFDDDFEPDPPSTTRHVETLPDDEFPARHVETLPEADELPGERFDGFEEPDALDDPEAPQVLDGHQVDGETPATPPPDLELEAQADIETVDVPSRESLEERPQPPTPGSGNGEKPASPSAGESE
ncbi:MAG: twin-arginine translocase TatA/TatE family subunit [Actinomycetota bacterium]